VFFEAMKKKKISRQTLKTHFQVFFIVIPADFRLKKEFSLDSLTLKLIKRRRKESKINLTSEKRKFDLVPMKHEYMVHDGIDIRKESHPSWNHMFLSFFSYVPEKKIKTAHQKKTRSLDDEKFFKPNQITNSCVGVCAC
jgi:hypothetical protein